jgi:hypothetical protein
VLFLERALKEKDLESTISLVVRKLCKKECCNKKERNSVSQEVSESVLKS